MRRLIFVLGLLALYGGSLLWKGAVIEQKKSVEKPTLISIREQQGAPVEVFLAKKKTFNKFVSVSGVVNESGLMRTKVTSNMAEKIRGETKAIIEVDNKTYIGKVKSVSRSAELLSGLHAVSIRFPKMPKFYKDRLLVAKIPYVSRDNVVVIPRKSVFQEEDKRYIFTVINDTLKRKSIQVLDENTRSFAVKSGLNIGETVVSSDTRNLEDGMKVLIVSKKGAQ